ncbi:uncharacterized protein LOC129754426 [Uranotaenia lowii]|uniref:uncharacterized protein LOC129754426 n=1 Tax=Uranotaenia lowii TaxID=190385 RepID=UPI00247A88D8|nr:uncharacterized protein LOC129754426 [Uranotaenia lowii]
MESFKVYRALCLAHGVLFCLTCLGLIGGFLVFGDNFGFDEVTITRILILKFYMVFGFILIYGTLKKELMFLKVYRIFLIASCVFLALATILLIKPMGDLPSEGKERIISIVFGSILGTFVFLLSGVWIMNQFIGRVELSQSRDSLVEQKSRANEIYVISL